jgi:ubiquitin carboxyl-terminal hydrolase 1
MSSWQQQDAQEYFSKVVDQIDIEIRKASRGQTRNMGLKIVGREENVVRDTSPELEVVDEEDALSTLTIEKSSFRNPLEGLLAQRVGCMKCGWTEGLSLIPFNCLTVPLGGKFEYDVRECLGQYMILEPIEGVECAKCTLLHCQEQLRSLLSGIEEDQKASLSSDSVHLNDAVKASAEERLAAVKEALEENDFAEKTLANKCHIPSKSRVSTTKSRQAVIARTPKCLVVHINRSLFDEITGMLKKNYAAVKFPKTLDLGDWCLGAQGSEQESLEQWVMNPAESMLPRPGEAVQITTSPQYELRAIITHYGRHENGHYICYRKYPTAVFPAQPPDEVLQVEGDKEKAEHWYRLSDEDVQMVSEAHVMSQGGAFMLFYEAVDESPLAHPNHMQSETAESVSNSTMSENLSAASTVTDAESSTSRATSVSTPERAALPVEYVKATVPPLKTSNAVKSAVHAPAEEISTQSVATTS